MTLTTLIALNAILDLAVALAVVAIVRFTHLLHHDDAQTEHLHLFRPLPLHVVLPPDEDDEVARAA